MSDPGFLLHGPGQPIFHPVLNVDYATRIAVEWNVPRERVGYVLAFVVAQSFLDGYDTHQVGGRTIVEYWIPAEDLDGFNDHIAGPIRLVRTPGRVIVRTGPESDGLLPARTRAGGPWS